MQASAALAVLLALAPVWPVFGIAPELSPVSDKKFFGSRGDYPTDTRNNKILPKVNNFNYPFPIVQDSNTYDKDYVKDENSDNNYWKYQTEYDRLRSKLAFKLKVLEDAKATAAGHQPGSGSSGSNGSNGSSGSANPVEDATNAVNQAELDLQKCLSELEAAKRELARRKSAEEEAHNAEDKKEKDEATAEEQEKIAKTSEEKAEEKLGEESEEAAESQRTLAEEKEEFEKASADLKEAEAELRKFMPARKAAQPGSEAGVPCPKGCQKAKSAAPRAEASLIVCLVAAFLSVRVR